MHRRTTDASKRIHKTILNAFLILLLCLAAPFCACADDAQTVTVFSAGSTINAVTDIGNLFAEKKMGAFKPSFAASSTLAKQIDQGAPADVYISANPKWMNFLEEKKMIEPGSRFDLLSNRLVIVAPADSNINVEIAPGFDLAGLLGEDKLSMGDPDHVPAGIYGKQALESLKVWKSVESKVARGKDVRAALALVERGEVPLGIVYATDAAITQKVKVVGVFPEGTHPPITYPAAIIAGKATPVAKSFLKFLTGDDAKAIFEKYGFSVR